jgi:hypothetical protein
MYLILEAHVTPSLALRLLPTVTSLRFPACRFQISEAPLCEPALPASANVAAIIGVDALVPPNKNQQFGGEQPPSSEL